MDRYSNAPRGVNLPSDGLGALVGGAELIVESPLSQLGSRQALVTMSNQGDGLQDAS